MFKPVEGIVRFGYWLTVVYVLFRSDIGFESVWSSGFILARTSFFLREGLALYAITGGDGKIWFSSALFLINVQCFRKIPLILFISSVHCVTKTSLSCCLVLTFLLRASFLSLNGMSLMWPMIWLCLYPLCLSFCINLSDVELKLVSFELVLRYRFVSPLAIALMVVGGGDRMWSGHRVVYWFL